MAMSADVEAELEKFASQFESATVSDEFAHDMLKRARVRAYDHFLELGLPERGSEAFQYVRLRPLFGQALEKALPCEVKKEALLIDRLEGCEGAFLVFANGYFRYELSDLSKAEGAVIQPLSSAVKTFGALLNTSWAKTLKEETDPFAALNAACHQEGIFIYLPPKCELTHPLQIHYFSEVGEASWIMPRVHIVLGKGAKATFIETVRHCPSPSYVFENRALEIHMEEGARVDYVQYEIAPKEMLPTTSFASVRAFVKRSGFFSAHFLLSGPMSRKSIKVQLAGEGAEAYVHGIWMLDEAKESHTNVVIEHQEPHCKSMQLFKGVLAASSRSSFEGKILVRRKAQKTEAYQLNNNLLLSNKAEAAAKPNLEIFADDVKASHGATSGQLDSEQLFYLRARGLGEKEARSCLIQGFCQEVMNLLPYEPLKKLAQETIERFATHEPAP